jgi:hypothetical protein
METFLSFALVLVAAPALLALGIYADLRSRRRERARRGQARSAQSVEPPMHLAHPESPSARSAPRARDEAHAEMPQQA